MDDQSRHLTALDGDDADALAETALEAEYFARLEAYLDDERGVTVPTENARAFERGDGVRAVSFADGTNEPGAADGEARPDVAITVHVVQATGERHDGAEGTVELAFPAETAPTPEAAVTDILRPDGRSVDVTVDESDDITVYTTAL